MSPACVYIVRQIQALLLASGGGGGGGGGDPISASITMPPDVQTQALLLAYGDGDLTYL